MSAECLVRLEDVDKTFYTRHFFQRDLETQQRKWYTRKGVHAAKQISFDIKAGEIFGLLGPNGAGKTTTVKMISGLVRPDHGSVYVDALEVERKRLQVLRKVGVVLEGTRTSIWPLTPLENLKYYGNLKDVKGKTLKERAESLLDFIGLKHKRDIQVRRLSRGEKQKLAICIALIADPLVILLDEPTTGLDVQSSRMIKDKIREMTHELGKSVLVTTHDMHVAQELCDRIGIINKGELVACKPTEELLDIFSDRSFEFHLDRLPAPAEFDDIPGVHREAPCTLETGEPALVAQIDADPEVRSNALYAVISRLAERNYILRSVNERQKKLEDVFLHITRGIQDIDEEA